MTTISPAGTNGVPSPMPAGDIHRIGGASGNNLRLKPQEAKLTPPGISVLRAPSPMAAAAEMRAAYPDATGLHEATKTVGTSAVEGIRAAGLDGIANRTKRLPSHHRLIHPDGAAGFTDSNLATLAAAFVTTTGN